MVEGNDFGDVLFFADKADARVQCDGDPLPSFEGEPKLVAIPDDMKAFTDMLWNSLNEDNKVSLFVRYIDIATGEAESVSVNKNK